ncbi:unnamed protein product [Peronospora destructor]|uniref:Uncharacterized protein n=1 Tax=Peronospora destructor TaxID=86335 RepID=A0AAV0VI99_9STRA|nr:unnamed protein product [Peronospora destructor]
MVAQLSVILQVRIKAIKNAHNYIYIENHYFILVPELLNALLQVMPSLLQHVIVVVQAPVDDVVYSGYEKYLHEMLPLKKKYPNKPKVYTTKHTIKSPDRITVNKLPRDFRIHKYHEMTGLSYNELDAMTFLDTPGQFDIAAADDMSLLQTLLPKD